MYPLVTFLTLVISLATILLAVIGPPRSVSIDDWYPTLTFVAVVSTTVQALNVVALLVTLH